MRKFIIKTSFFSLPFAIIYFLNTVCYDQSQGDLTRLGYLYTNALPKSEVSKQFFLSKQYTLVSELDLNTKTNFDVLTIGDSFAEQDSLGFKNFLAHQHVSVVHMDRFLAANPIQKIIELSNSTFFDSITTNYVVLQSVERIFVQRCQEIDFKKTIQLDDIKNQINTHTKKPKHKSLSFFSDATLKIPLTNIQYLFKNKPTYSKTYKVPLVDTSFFSGDQKSLMFYQDDLDLLNHKNDSLKIVKANQVINKISTLLANKNIQLILVISPDKYDVYYPYIHHNENFRKPMFFSYFNTLKKEYTYINTLEILSEKLKEQRDVYYYDDTHWSPHGAKTIATAIKKVM